MAPSHPPGHAPTLDSFLHTKLHLEATVETATSLLKRRQIRGPEPCALATAHVLAQVVAKSKWVDVDQLLDRVCQTGRKLVDAQPQELVIGNIVRRVLGLIRDEAEEDRNEAGGGGGGGGGTDSMASSVQDLRAATAPSAVSLQSHALPSIPTLASSPSLSNLARGTRQPSLIATGPYQSMFSLLSAADTPSSLTSGDVSSAGGSGTSTPIHGPPGAALLVGSTNTGSSSAAAAATTASSHNALRDEILDGIEEIKDEIGQADDQIAGFAEAQVRPGDYVMVYEPTRTVEKFLIKAAARRRYTLLLASSSSRSSGADAPARYASLLKRLAAAKCTVVQIAGSAAAAYMTRASRVVLDARAIVANGGVLANAGAARIARAAHAQGRPVLVLGGVFKLAPEPVTDPDAFVEWGDPGRLVAFADGSMVDGIDIETAVTEYVPPGLIDVYVTNLGPHPRDYLENVIADHYKNEDLELCKH